MQVHVINHSGELDLAVRSAMRTTLFYLVQSKVDGKCVCRKIDNTIFFNNIYYPFNDIVVIDVEI